MRPILALNSLLQLEQDRSEEESSVGDALALAFRTFLLDFADSFCSPSYEHPPPPPSYEAFLWGLATFEYTQSLTTVVKMIGKSVVRRKYGST